MESSYKSNTPNEPNGTNSPTFTPNMAGQESILLTGATGNVGAVILDQLLLTTSHNVTAVLRKSFYIPLLEKKYPEQVANKRLTFTVIPDMAIAGAFDAAAASITAIIHVATPIATGDWEEKMIKPTWDIDRNILETAKNSNSVKRVVICGTILQVLASSHKSLSISDYPPGDGLRRPR
jgi:NADPH-dependent methylglyoxal reductase